MQQVISRPGPQMPPGGDGKPQSQKQLIIVLTLFAFSGLLIGFTVGAYTRAPHTTQLVTKGNTGVVAGQGATTPSPTAGINIAAVGVGCPIINTVQSSEMADGTTAYTFTAQVVDKGNDPSPCGKNGKPLYAADLMCKVWLTQDVDSLKTLIKNKAIFKPDNLPNAFPAEEQGTLVFDGGNSQQLQPCSQTGLTSWSYKLSPTLKSGTYYLAILSDWHGTYYNWSWVPITIKGQ